MAVEAGVAAVRALADPALARSAAVLFALPKSVPTSSAQSSMPLWAMSCASPPPFRPALSELASLKLLTKLPATNDAPSRN